VKPFSFPRPDGRLLQEKDESHLQIVAHAHHVRLGGPIPIAVPNRSHLSVASKTLVQHGANVSNLFAMEDLASRIIMCIDKTATFDA
jgi:hypothetical protein